MTSESKLDFEDILKDVGDAGKYQIRLLMIFFLIVPLISWFDLNIFFMIAVPDHWCYVPEFATSNMSTEEERLLVRPSIDPNCQIYDVNYTEILFSGIYGVLDNSTIKPCENGWQYDKTHYDYTAATQWNMYCKDNHYPSFVLMMFNVGSIIGTPIYGSLSDRFGRKLTLLGVLILTSVTSVASVLVTNFTAFVIIKSINGSILPSLYQLPFIIVLELLSPKMRTHMNGFANCVWAVGVCFLPLVAYLSRNWITLGLVVSAGTSLIFLFWIGLPESPRWLVSQGKFYKAANIMKRISNVNGKRVDHEDLLSKLKILGRMIKNEGTDEVEQTSSLDLLKHPELRKIFIILNICWIANVASFYGLQLNVSNLSGNEFINFFLTSIVEIPGSIIGWIIMHHYGRKWCSTGGFVITGIACMLSAAISGYPYADIICSMLGKLSASATYMSIYQQSSELYPTVLRSSGMGLNCTIGTIFMLGVPYVIYLSTFGKIIPFVVFGLVSVLAAIFSIFLPETLNRNLPQTISDVEELGKSVHFLSRQRQRNTEMERDLPLELHVLQ